MAKRYTARDPRSSQYDPVEGARPVGMSAQNMTDRAYHDAMIGLRNSDRRGRLRKNTGHSPYAQRTDPGKRPPLDATDDQRYLGVDAQTRERDVEKRKSQRKSQRRASGKRAGPRKKKRSSARSAAKRRR
jgi:hypothetical protein